LKAADSPRLIGASAGISDSMPNPIASAIAASQCTYFGNQKRVRTRKTTALTAARMIRPTRSHSKSVETSEVVCMFGRSLVSRQPRCERVRPATSFHEVLAHQRNTTSATTAANSDGVVASPSSAARIVSAANANSPSAAMARSSAPSTLSIQNRDPRNR